MKLSRRDALAALAAGSVGSITGCSAPEGPAAGESDTLDNATLDVLVAAAEVVYPSEASAVDEFVRTYAVGRVADDPDHREGLTAAAAALDDLARDREGEEFAELSPNARDVLLRSAGVNIADPNPTGPLPARLRYYVVNDLLYAFYASPTGGELVGIENPVGHPGGTESYQQPPPGNRDRDDDEETDGTDGTDEPTDTEDTTETTEKTNTTDPEETTDGE